jgi:uncharacterized protein YraI
MKLQRLCFASVATFAIFAFSHAAIAAKLTSPLNVRSGPGATWPVIATVPAGADVEVQSCESG